MVETVHGTLTARIDRLAPENKRLLRTAGVVAKDTPCAILRAIVQDSRTGEDSTLHDGLAHLQAAEFPNETALFPEPEYTNWREQSQYRRPDRAPSGGDDGARQRRREASGFG